MKYYNKFLCWLVCCILLTIGTYAQQPINFEHTFGTPSKSAKPWVFWYWMHSAYTKAGITADLEAMKETGIAGAYIAPIKGKTDPLMLVPVIETLTPEWWQLIRFTLEEADRLGIEIAMLPNDGFATAGGPWITPDISMQKVVWSTTYIKGGTAHNDRLPAPPSYEGYYKDIAVLAFPTPVGEHQTTLTIVPKVTTSIPDIDAQFLTSGNSKMNFTSKGEPCWIQYEFEKPFTARSINVHINGYNHQALRMIVEVSDDGKTFRRITRMEPPRSGWLDWDADFTTSLEPVTARYYRFLYDPEGTEPGAEDLDAAKWKPGLKVGGILLSSAPRIHQYEGKSGVAWRISRETTPKELPSELCVPADKIINISQYMDATGKLSWKAPAGNWTILRMAHTSTGHKNETAGASGKGLECDKFNPETIKFQFDKWFGEAIRVAGPDLAKRVLTTFHIDSWECGSQNWSTVFREEFKQRRGYDPVLFLPAMAGIPVTSADVSEKFLHDIRQTIAELIGDNCFKTLATLAHERGCVFTSETVAPVMVSDGLLHFKHVDVPMGEFWLNSPTHDKPNDMLDAISGARIYGKQKVQAEAFTTIRMAWNEHPGMLKTLQDRNYALGINQLVYHVYVQNPWMDRKPGMTLDGIGLYFQRDQTWWKQGKEWVNYAQRCHSLLQMGRPAVDIAVFTGEEIPSRAVLPERLVSTLPGIFGAERVQSEYIRMANVGQPQRSKPRGVTNSANMAFAEDWTDPLRGYAYDSFNPDALLNLAKVNKGRIELPGGASYGLLVLPLPSQMTPGGDKLSPAVAKRLKDLKAAGATIITGKYEGESFDALGIERDLIARDQDKTISKNIAWTHRTGDGFDIYFFSNQKDSMRVIDLSLRVTGRVPELWDAVSADSTIANEWRIENGRTLLPVRLAPNGSVFIVLKQNTALLSSNKGQNWNELKSIREIDGTWMVKFDTAFGGPDKSVLFNMLEDWSKNEDPSIRNYSGTAVYSKSFNYKLSKKSKPPVWLDLGKIANLATVRVNGIDCGTLWTAPYQVDISKALKNGSNSIEIEITNTWANRLIGDNDLPEDKKTIWTTAPFRIGGVPLEAAGLLGPVVLLQPVR